jgi:hypothetical protein
MTDQYLEDLRDWEARNTGQTRIEGKLSGRYSWDGACIGFAEFCTNGPQGGDAGWGGFVRFAFTNSASTCIEVAVDGAEPRLANSVEIIFRGDAEIDAAIRSLEFISAKLKAIRELC